MLRARGAALLTQVLDGVASTSGRLPAALAGLQSLQGRLWGWQQQQQQQRGYAEPAVQPASHGTDALESQELSPSSIRSGVIAVKVGMTQVRRGNVQ